MVGWTGPLAVAAERRVDPLTQAAVPTRVGDGVADQLPRDGAVVHSYDGQHLRDMRREGLQGISHFSF